MKLQNFSINFLDRKIKIISVFLVVIITTTLIASVTALALILNSNKIYDGIHINNLPVGGLTVSELRIMLEDNYTNKIKNTYFTFKYKERESKISFSDIGVKYDIDNVIKRVNEYGRRGNLFERMSEILDARKSGFDFEIPYTYDKNKLDLFIYDFSSKHLAKVKQSELSIKGDKAYIHSGHIGEEIDSAQLKEEINNAAGLCKDISIEIPVIIVKPIRINIEDYYTRITRAPVDAFTKVENNRITVVPHVLGRSVDKTTLESVVSDIEKGSDKAAVLQIKYLTPKRTTSEVQSKILKDTLSTWNTQFSTNTEIEKNRSENIKVAVSKINGKIFAPGEVFSFNEVVGKRTEELGYKDAYVYVDGKVVPGLGGGICQVSSTLYNAILPLGFQIVERRNHTFTVSYAELGMDAAVAYGSVDFKFKNSSRWPIKILSSITKENKVIFSIIGTNEGNKKIIEYETKITKTLENKIKYIDDPSLPVGKTKVKQKGSKGFVVDTYKVIKQDGKVITKSKLYTSYYKPLDKEILKGTKRVISNK